VAQHFLLSPLARALKDAEFLGAITNDEATARILFQMMRWGSLATQTCPACGVIDAHFPRPRYNGWRCKHCGHDFSVTSRSLFDNTKLPMWKIVKGIYLFVTNSKGRSAIDISHKLDIGYRAAYLLLHKIRWAFALTPRAQKLKGEFEVDCVWVLKGIRDFNNRSPAAFEARQQRKQDRLCSRLVREGIAEAKAAAMAKKEHPLKVRPRRDNPKKQCILGIARRHPDGKGSDFVMGFPIAKEDAAIIRPLVLAHIEPGSVIYSDGAAAYVSLGTHYEMRAVNHDEVYVNEQGWHTNFIESHFARWRRMEIGTYHRMNARTLYLYFSECSWRETFRCSSPIVKLVDTLKRCVKVGVSRDFRSYPLSTVLKARPARRVSSKRRVVHPSLEKKVNAMFVQLGLVPG